MTATEVRTRSIVSFAIFIVFAAAAFFAWHLILDQRHAQTKPVLQSTHIKTSGT